jgi:hypothetical protein
MDTKITITTNYDLLLNTIYPAHEGYVIRDYTYGRLVDDIRSPQRIAVKAHGCVTAPQTIVLTRSSYYDARARHLPFYNLLDALFLTNTILFIGCGLEDPDIQLVLENANIAFPSGHPHYALVAKGRHPALIGSTRKAHNIKLIEYDNSAGDHAEAVSMLGELVDAVRSYRATMPR